MQGVRKKGRGRKSPSLRGEKKKKTFFRKKLIPSNGKETRADVLLITYDAPPWAGKGERKNPSRLVRER